MELNVTYPKDTYVCRALIRWEPDDEYHQTGTFVAYCENLPGVATQGDTYEEALANLREAFTGVVEWYLAAGKPINWADQRVSRWERDVSMSVHVPMPTTPNLH